MTLNELRYILAVNQEKHFRKAAEKCFVSQPTLSVAVKKLEEELGVCLFERHKHEILTTPIGQKVIELSEEILKLSKNIKELAKEYQGDLSAELKIGAIYTIAPYLFPKLIPNFHALAPNVPLIIEENYTHILAEKLKTGELDIAILSLPFDEPNIETFSLYEEPFKLIFPKETKTDKKSYLKSIDQIQNETILLLGAGHCFRDQVVESFPHLLNPNQKSNQLQKTFEGSSLETIRYMVASGVGISIFPCSTLSERDESLLTIKELPNPKPSRIVALAWRKSFPRVKVLALFKQAALAVNVSCTKKSN